MSISRVTITTTTISSDEDIMGATFLSPTRDRRHFLLPAQFGNGLLDYNGFEIAPEWQPTINLETAWLLFISGYEFEGGADEPRCRHDSGD